MLSKFLVQHIILAYLIEVNFLFRMLSSENVILLFLKVTLSLSEIPLYFDIGDDDGDAR